jgi:hypothetical protein
MAKAPKKADPRVYAKSGRAIILHVDEKWSAAKQEYTYYFVVRRNVREKGCPVESQRLLGGYEAARAMATKLNEKWLAWELGMAADTSETPLTGTWGWLVTTYTKERKFLDMSQPYNREWHLRLVGKVRLADGSTIWDTDLNDMSGRVADRIFQVLLPTLKKNSDDELVEAERRTVAVKACHYSRSAWNEMRRLDPHIVPEINAFSSMGLKLESKETPAAELEELADFMLAADSLGEFNIAAMARTCWDWCQRAAHAARDFRVVDFSGPRAEQWAYVRHPKVGKKAVWMPLVSTEGAVLFPELSDRLVSIKGEREDGLLFYRDEHFRRTGEMIPWVTPTGSLKALQTKVRDIMEEAHITRLKGMSSFRQGGINELSELHLSDREIFHFTRQNSAASLDRYSKRSAGVIIGIQQQRLIHQMKPRQPDPLLRRVGSSDPTPRRIAA